MQRSLVLIEKNYVVIRYMYLKLKKEIWNKNAKIWFFKNPFYYWNQEKIIKTLIEIIYVLIDKNNEFFGVNII